MNTLSRIVLSLVVLGANAAQTHAAESPRELFEQMLAPDRVLASADALGLDAKQRESVRRVQAETQPRMPPLLRQMADERDALIALLKAERPDEAAVLARFDKLNAIETEVKRLRIQMTLGLKKILTAEQQETARALPGKPLAENENAAPDTLAAKLHRVKQGLEQWKREGRDVAPLRARWERFREAEDRGHYRQARLALDEAIALLDAPPPKP
jgi:Spy/CpxP family protein refolding chaperone